MKTSITLPQDLLVRLDRVDKNRSAVLERAAIAYLSSLDQQVRARRDIAIIERNAKRLNREAQTRSNTSASGERSGFYLVRKPGPSDPGKQRVCGS